MGDTGNRARNVIASNCVLAILTLMIAVPALSDDDRRSRYDHDIARKALLQGEILRLEDILIEVRKSAPGEFIDVKLRRKHKSWVYQFKVLTPDGALIKVVADAGTGEILKVKLRESGED